MEPPAAADVLQRKIVDPTKMVRPYVATE